MRLLGNTLGLDFIASKYVNKTKCEINVYCNYYSSLTTRLSCLQVASPNHWLKSSSYKGLDFEGELVFCPIKYSSVFEFAYPSTHINNGLQTFQLPKVATLLLGRILATTCYQADLWDRKYYIKPAVQLAIMVDLDRKYLYTNSVTIIGHHCGWRDALRHYALLLS